MLSIKHSIKTLKSRLKLAECDIDYALQYKDQFPELAKTHYNLSLILMEQVSQQHDALASFITDYRKAGNEVPPAMQAIYDYVHEEYIEWAVSIKKKQELFK